MMEKTSSSVNEHLVDYSNGIPRVATSGQSEKIAPVYSPANWGEKLPRNTFDSRVDPASLANNFSVNLRTRM
jgi:hypothetical protein